MPSTSKRAPRCFAIAWLFLHPACGVSSDETIAVTSEAITHGTVDDTDTAVVAIVADGTLDCTGTLIGPTLVLTAAHCLGKGNKLSAHFGVDARSPDFVVPVIEAHAHPAFDPATLDNDVAVLLLAFPADGVIPRPIATAEDELRTDGALRVVGFGRTGPLAAGPTAGTRHSGRATPSGVSADRVTLVPGPSQPCSGDSGGPVFASDARGELVVAVTSAGDADCVAGAVATRVSAYLSFLAPWLDPQPAGGCRASRANDGLALALAVAAAVGLRRRKRKSHMREGTAAMP